MKEGLSTCHDVSIISVQSAIVFALNWLHLYVDLQLYVNTTKHMRLEQAEWVTCQLVQLEFY